MFLSDKVFKYASFSSIISQLISLKILDEQALQNEHIDYLNDYLNFIGAKSYILEKEYIDHDYMEDYTRYYARCFQKYPKWCSRIIFFNKKIDIDKIKEGIIQNKTSIIKKLQQDFIGFIVIRPIPKTLLGKVCLKVYPIKNNLTSNRVFPVLREYKIHFLGIELVVESLAFQEQDNAIAACATSALWSALHAIGYNWGKNYISSPSEITQNAKKIIDKHTGNSSFPHKGLQPSQMAQAIKDEGFEPLTTGFINTSYLKAIIRGYMNAHIPIIIGVRLMYENEEGVRKDGIPRSVPIGFHAVTINGYNIDKSISPKIFSIEDLAVHTDFEKRKDLRMFSSRINKLYVHDDRLGPFVKMEFKDEYYQRLETHWYEYTSKDKVNADVNIILLPLYHKIRIKFHSIFHIIYDFNTYYMNGWEDIEWDIQLFTVCDLKKEWMKLKDDEIEDSDLKLNLLSLHLPKFILVATALNSGKEKKIFSLLFDATDLDNSNFFIYAVHYNIESFYITYINAQLAKEYNAKDEDNLYNYQSYKILSQHLDLKSKKILKPENNNSDTDKVISMLSSKIKKDHQ